MNDIPVIISIDVEPDKVVPDITRPEPWSGFVATHEYFSTVRQQLESVTGSPVHFSWMMRMDPQVEVVYGSANWVAKEYSATFADLQQRGDELGLHVHATRWDEANKSWHGDYGNQEWVASCVTKAFAAFEQTFDRKCESISLGDRWSNHETIALFEELGAKYCLSIEPGARPQGDELLYEFTGTWPEYFRAPYLPYIPDTEDYLKPEAKSGRQLWLIPLSAGKYDGPNSYRWHRLKKVAKSFGFDRQRDHESTVLKMHLSSESFRRNVDGLLNISRMPYLAFVLRAEVGLEPPKRANLEANINHLRDHPLARRFRFVTPEGLIRMLSN